jgi:hypothetical protein
LTAVRAGALATQTVDARKLYAPLTCQIARHHRTVVRASRLARGALTRAIAEKAALTVAGLRPSPLAGRAANLITSEATTALAARLTDACAGRVEACIRARHCGFPVARRVTHRDALRRALLDPGSTFAGTIRVFADERANALRDELAVPACHHVFAVALLRAFGAATHTLVRRAQRRAMLDLHPLTGVVAHLPPSVHTTSITRRTGSATRTVATDERAVFLGLRHALIVTAHDLGLIALSRSGRTPQHHHAARSGCGCGRSPGDCTEECRRCPNARATSARRRSQLQRCTLTRERKPGRCSRAHERIGASRSRHADAVLAGKAWHASGSPHANGTFRDE